jgi:NAD(P)-dependent dehydrogenase (short-subunit alcohol dehydrogenase family)
MSNPAPVIVVTGGNRGIGFEICRQLASRGAQVVLTARQPEAGQAAASRLASQKPAAQFHPLNVTEPESIAALRDFLERTFGRLDVLVNNAGIITDEEASGLEVKLSTVRATLETNTLTSLGANTLTTAQTQQRGSHREYVQRHGRAFGHGRRLRGLSHFQGGLERSHRSSPLNCAARLRSTPCALAGSKPTWAAQMPSGTFRKAQTPPSGSRSTRRRI